MASLPDWRRRQLREPGGAAVHRRQRTVGAWLRQPAAPRSLRRPHRRFPSEQCLRRHTHHRARLQPDANLYEWTEAINACYRSQLREEFQILGVVERGFAKGLQGAGFGWSGFIANCPVVFRLL
jgi:hypothetical protein